MKDKFFLDTSIFVYSFNSDANGKRQVARQLISHALDKQVGCISYQVVQEFLNVATRKFVKPLSVTDCRRYLNSVLEPLCEIYGSVELYHQALEIAERWQYSFYDSLIITAAINSKCSILYTEDLRHGQKIQNLMVANPFL